MHQLRTFGFVDESDAKIRHRFNPGAPGAVSVETPFLDKKDVFCCSASILTSTSYYTDASVFATASLILIAGKLCLSPLSQAHQFLGVSW
jgi:hypothetical protein